MNILRNVQPGERAEAAGIPPSSMLGLAYEQRSWSKDGLMVPFRYYYDVRSADGSIQETIQNIEIIGDIGNNEAKFAAWSRTTGVLLTRGTTTTLQGLRSAIYSTSTAAVWQQQFYDEKQATIYRREQIDTATTQIPPQYSEEVYVGDNAKESLITGATDARFSQDEYLLFIRICICDMLEAAGYFQENADEVKNVGLCLGVRNEETSQGKGLRPEVKSALDGLLGPCTLLKRVGETEVIRRFHIREYATLPQSWGAIYAIDTDIMGHGHLVDADGITGLDGGWFDIHMIEGARVGDGMRVSGEKITDGGVFGGVFLARGLAAELRKPENFPHLGVMTDAEAREALRSGTFRLGGKALKAADAQKAAALIRAYKDVNGTRLIGSLASRHPKLDTLFVFYGGLMITLKDQIVEKMTDLRRPRDLYLTLPYDDEIQLPKFANVIGLAGLFNLRNRKRATR